MYIFIPHGIHPYRSPMVVITHKNRYLRENVHSHEILKGLKEKTNLDEWKSTNKVHIIYKDGQNPHIDNYDLIV